MDNTKHRRKCWNLSRRRELIINAVLIGIVILGSYGFIFGLTWALDNPRPFAVVDGTSMLPTYRDKDLVVVQGVNPSEIKLGDVIIYHQPNNYENLIIHRVINVSIINDQIFFKAKGDNNFREDPWLIPANNVVGKAIYHAPSIGLIFIVLTSPLIDGITLGNFLSILIIALLIFTSYRTPLREKNEETENPVKK